MTEHVPRCRTKGLLMQCFSKHYERKEISSSESKSPTVVVRILVRYDSVGVTSPLYVQ